MSLQVRTRLSHPALKPEHAHKSPCPIIHVVVTLQKGCQRHSGQCTLRKQLKDITCPTQLKTHSGLTSLDWHSNRMGICVCHQPLLQSKAGRIERRGSPRGHGQGSSHFLLAQSSIQCNGQSQVALRASFPFSES